MNYDVVLRHHVEDAALHWAAFDETVSTQPSDHPDIYFYGKRIEPHLKGIGLATDRAWPLALDAIMENPGEADVVFVAMWTALTGGNAEKIAHVAHLAGGSPDAAQGAIGAVNWIPAAQMKPFVPEWLREDDPILRAMALRACQLHRSKPNNLNIHLSHAASIVRQEATSLSARLAPDLFKKYLDERLADPDLNTRHKAALTAAQLGYRDQAISTWKELAQTPSETSEQARDWAVMAMGPRALADWAKEMQPNEPLVIRLVGLSGATSYWPWLIDRMDNPKTSQISGLAAQDLSSQDLFADDYFYDDAVGLPKRLQSLDPDAYDIPNAAYFRTALDEGQLNTPDDPDAWSTRAHRLDGMRKCADAWPSEPIGAS